MMELEPNQINFVCGAQCECPCESFGLKVQEMKNWTVSKPSKWFRVFGYYDNGIEAMYCNNKYIGDVDKKTPQRQCAPSDNLTLVCKSSVYDLCVGWVDMCS